MDLHETICAVDHKLAASGKVVTSEPTLLRGSQIIWHAEVYKCDKDWFQNCLLPTLPGIRLALWVLLLSTAGMHLRNSGSKFPQLQI